MNLCKYCIYIFWMLVTCISLQGQETVTGSTTVQLQNQSLHDQLAIADSLFHANHIKKATKSYKKLVEQLKATSNTDTIKSVGFKVVLFFVKNTEHYEDALRLLKFLEVKCKEANDIEGMALVHKEYGSIYNKRQQYVQALENFNKSLKYAEQHGDPDITWSTLISRGKLFSYIGYPEQSLQDFKNALSCVKHEGSKYNRQVTYINISTAFPGRYPDSTLYYCRLALVGCEENNTTRNCMIAYNNIAWSYYEKNMPEQALELIKKNIDPDADYMVDEDFDNLYPGFMHTLGAIEADLASHKKAIKYFSMAERAYTKREDIANMIIVKEDLSRVYEKIGNLPKSLALLKEVKSLEDSQLKIKVSKEWAKNEIGNLVQAKEQVISGLEKKNLIIKKQVNKTKWISYVLGVLLIITIVTVVYRGYRSRIRYYQISEKLILTRLSSLRASMNPHFLFNTFSTLQNYILKNDNLKANEYMTELSGLIRNVLNSSDSVHIDLDKELQILRSYVNLQQGRFQGEFEATFEVAEALEQLNPKIPSMIIQPFIENAILHGFSSFKKQGILTVSLTLDGETVRCVVQDNGIGRKASAAIKAKSTKNSHLSIATKNTNERLAILNKAGEEKSSVIINDLLDKEENSLGTEVVITLPIVQNHEE